MSARARTAAVLVLGLLYGVMWIGGVSAYVFRGGPQAHEAWTAPAFLTLAALIVLLAAGATTVPRLGLVLAAGFAAEYAGVRCGCVFGEYEYTRALSPRVLGVPIVMSAAWMVLVAYVQELRLAVGWGRSASAVVGAAWMTAIDLLLDPVAAGPLRYWTWTEPGGWYYGVPAQNFAGWFAVSLLIFALLPGVSWPRSRVARSVGLTIVAFFAIIAAAGGLIVPALVGALLCAADLRVAWTPHPLVPSSGAL